MERKAINEDNVGSRRVLVCDYEIDEIMELCIKLIKKGEISAYSKITKIINDDFTEKCLKRAINWKDNNGLNVIHHAIIYRRPEILQYLLKDISVFPMEFQPTICPYAHLAAFVGATSCIKIILTHRPGDSFKSDLPQHEIKLPDYILDVIPVGRQDCTRDVSQLIKDFYEKSQTNVFGSLEHKNSDDIEDLNAFLNESYKEDANAICLPSISVGAPEKKTNKLALIQKPKTYKELFFRTKDRKISLPSLGKHPLRIAAEYGHLNTVKAILETRFSFKSMKSDSQNSFYYLTAATKSFSPEAIAALLATTPNIELQDYQNACLEAIRNLYPDCLLALLSGRPDIVLSIFGGVNLYHLLYSQTIDADQHHYEMLPTMTQVLVYCGKDVNDYTISNTFPMYSLITCLFNLTSTKKLYKAFETLKYLLLAGADPYFNEKTQRCRSENKKSVMRDLFTSGYNCIFENALKKYNNCSIENTDNRVPKTIMKHSVLFLMKMNKKGKKLPLEVLFQYLETSCYLGLDKVIIEQLLSSGANPNKRNEEGKFPLNAYFDILFQDFPNWHQNRSNDFVKNEMQLLIMVCQSMEMTNLREAVRTILKQYVNNIPLGTVLTTRYFLYLADNLMKENEKNTNVKLWSFVDVIV